VWIHIVVEEVHNHIVSTTSSSPERFFSRVGLVQNDLFSRLLDTTMMDLMWFKETPYLRYDIMTQCVWSGRCNP
jgi:hypothetical protein